MNRDREAVLRIIEPVEEATLEAFLARRPNDRETGLRLWFGSDNLAKADRILAALPVGGGVEEAASEWLGELADRLEMLAPDVPGSTHLNGEIRSFRHIVTVSAKQLRRFAALPPRSADGEKT